MYTTPDMRQNGLADLWPIINCNNMTHSKQILSIFVCEMPFIIIIMNLFQTNKMLIFFCCNHSVCFCFIIILVYGEIYDEMGKGKNASSTLLILYAHIFLIWDASLSLHVVLKRKKNNNTSLVRLLSLTVPFWGIFCSNVEDITLLYR